MSAASRFIRAVYGPATQLIVPGGRRRRWRGWWRRLRSRAPGWLRSPSAVPLLIGTTTTVGFLMLTAAYFNILVGGYYDALAARSKMEVVLQRRNDLMLSLEGAILASARHEAQVFARVSDKRVELGQARRPAPALPALTRQQLAGLPLDRLLALAEQYPEVRLSENFQSVIRALVEVEADLDRARKTYVDLANTYTHEVDTFPGNFFAKAFGFRRLPFFIADPDARRLRRVTY